MLLPLGFLEVLATVYILASPAINQFIVETALVIEELLAEIFLGNAYKV